MTTQRTKRAFKVRRMATFSLYDLGMHYTDPSRVASGRPSIRESMTLFNDMLEELYAAGVKIGDKLTVVIQKQARPRKARK